VYFINTKFAGWNGYCTLAERGAGTVYADVIVKLFLIIECTSRKFGHVYGLISKALLVSQLQQKTKFTMHLPTIFPVLVFSACVQYSPKGAVCLAIIHVPSNAWLPSYTA